MLAARSKCFFREEHPLQLLLQAFDENAIFLNYQFSSNSENPLNTTVSDDLDIVSKPVENYDYNKGVSL